MLQQVSEKLLGQFVESLEAKLAADGHAPQPPQPVDSRADSERPQPAAAPAPPRTEAAPIDLLELAGGGALKKYGPPVFGAFLAAAVLFTLGRSADRPKGVAP